MELQLSVFVTVLRLCVTYILRRANDFLCEFQYAPELVAGVSDLHGVECREVADESYGVYITGAVDCKMEEEKGVADRVLCGVEDLKELWVFDALAGFG